MSTKAKTPKKPAKWTDTILAIVQKAKGEITLPEVYKAVAKLAKTRAGTNHTYQATVRQTLQSLRDRELVVFVAKGVYKAA